MIHWTIITTHYRFGKAQSKSRYYDKATFPIAAVVRIAQTSIVNAKAAGEELGVAIWQTNAHGLSTDKAPRHVFST